MRRCLAAALALAALAGPVHSASMCNLTGGWTFANGQVALTFADRRRPELAGAAISRGLWFLHARSLGLTADMAGRP